MDIITGRVPPSHGLYRPKAAYTTPRRVKSSHGLDNHHQNLPKIPLH